MILYIIFFVLVVILMILTAIWFRLGIAFLKKPPVLRGIVKEQIGVKQHNLELILALFAKHDTLTNAIVRQELGFDDRVVVNYMDELEKMGKVKQIGEIGKYVYYELR